MFIRDVLRDKEDDDGSGNAPTVVAGPGETQDSMTAPLKPVKGAPDDKGDAVTDEEKAAAEAKAAEEKVAEEKAAEEKAAADKAAYDKMSDEEKVVADKKAAEDKIAADKAAADDGGKKVSVPKFRMDAALARARAAEKAAEEAKAALEASKTTPAKTVDDDETMTIVQAEKRVGELDAEIAKAMRDEDGTDEAVTALLKEQRELSEGIRDAKAEDAATAATSQTQEDIVFDRVVTNLEAEIPKLNPTHDDYDEELTQETVRLAKALRTQGQTQGDAMLMAVEYMAPKLGLDDGTDVVADVKKKTDIEGNLKKQKGLPPDVPGAKGAASDKGGVSADSRDISRMSDEEFDTLTQNPEELAKLRGDFVQ